MSWSRGSRFTIFTTTGNAGCSRRSTPSYDRAACSRIWISSQRRHRKCTSAYASWCEVYAEHGAELPLSTWVSEVVGRSAGATAFDPVAYLAEQVGGTIDAEGVLSRRAACKTRLAPTALLDGVDELIEEAVA